MLAPSIAICLPTGFPLSPLPLVTFYRLGCFRRFDLTVLASAVPEAVLFLRLWWSAPLHHPYVLNFHSLACCRFLRAVETD